MSKTAPRAGTEGLTVAWFAALAAIALVVVVGGTLLRSLLDDTEDELRFLEVVTSVRGDALTVTEISRALQAPLTPSTTVEPVSSFRSTVTRMERRAIEMRSSAPELAEDFEALIASAERRLARLTTSSAELTDATSVDRQAEAQRAEATATDLIGDLDELDRALRGRAQADGEQARRVNNAVLIGVLALLLVEALLVFLPATRAVRRTMERRRRQQEAERQHTREQLERLARYDQLTGLANRTLFRDRLDHAIAGAERSGQRVGVMFLDLDRFKAINDQFGHDAGDQLLVAVAGRLRACARKSDTVARLGGDEFTLILENLDSPDDAATVADKIIDSLRVPVGVDGNEIPVTTSIGIAIYPDDGTTIDALLREADSAMYHAKSDGRNTFQFSTVELRATNLARLETISQLRDSVARGELRLVYQPQLNLDTGRVVGVEAFVRWDRPDGTEVRAGEFIDLAEDTDLMVPLGEWVLREACRHSATWRDEGLASLRVAVNLSPRQFHDGNLAQTVTRMLTATGAEPSRLELEITEDTLVNNVEASSVTLRLLSGIGVRIVIDDFGTGYSSLGYLRDLPIDALKIDRSFVQHLGAGVDDDATVIPEAIIGLARHLGLETIAEGVETKDQVDVLRRIRCDIAQGYHYTEPIEASEVAAYVRRRSITSISGPVTDTGE